MPFTAAITVMVVATPEGLPLYSMKCLMPDHSLVQKPSACYTMNSATKKKKDFALTKQALNRK